jgi:hypothetical protein
MNEEIKAGIREAIEQHKENLKEWKKLSKAKGVHAVIQERIERLCQYNRAQVKEIKRLSELNDTELQHIRTQADDEALALLLDSIDTPATNATNTPIEQVPEQYRQEYTTTCRRLNAKGHFLRYDSTKHECPFSIWNSHNELQALPDMGAIRTWFDQYAKQQNL